MRRSLLLTASALIVFSPLRIAAQVTGLSGWNIFIDAGHSLTANMGAHGYSEAEKNLGVALEIYDLLMTTTDIDTVFLSRTQQSDNVGLSASVPTWPTAPSGPTSRRAGSIPCIATPAIPRQTRC